MEFTHEHQQIANTYQRIIEEQFNPQVDKWETEEVFPAHEVMKTLGDAGLLGISKPVEYGGLGLDFTYEIAAVEQLGRLKAAGVATAIGVQTLMCTPALASFGSDELRQEFLAPAIAGEQVGCIGVSEEGAGSDVANIRTYAKKDGDDYIINGMKMWITNSLQADWICLLVNTSEDNGPHKNKSLIIVPTNTPGIKRERLDTLGVRSSATTRIYFDNVRVPQRNRIGEEGMGFIYQMKQFQEERLYSSTRPLLYFENIIQETIEYTRQRDIYGSPLLDKQVVKFKLAELQSRVEVLRSLVYRAVDTYISGEDVTELASMCKYTMGQLAIDLPSACMQFWGGQGYLNENHVSRAYRDLRISAIGAGANEVMLQIISQKMGMGK